MEDIPELQADGSERGLIVYKGHTHSAQIGELGVFLPRSVCPLVSLSLSLSVFVCQSMTSLAIQQLQLLSSSSVLHGQ